MSTYFTVYDIGMSAAPTSSSALKSSFFLDLMQQEGLGVVQENSVRWFATPTTTELWGALGHWLGEAHTLFVY